MLFNLVFANNTILPCLFFCFLISDFKILILDLFAQIFNPVAELVIPIEILTKEAKAEMGTDPATVEAKPYLLQIIERTNVLSKMYDILEFLSFLYLPQTTQ